VSRVGRIDQICSVVTRDGTDETRVPPWLLTFRERGHVSLRSRIHFREGEIRRRGAETKREKREKGEKRQKATSRRRRSSLVSSLDARRFIPPVPFSGPKSADCPFRDEFGQSLRASDYARGDAVVNGNGRRSRGGSDGSDSVSRAQDSSKELFRDFPCNYQLTSG